MRTLPRPTAPWATSSEPPAVAGRRFSSGPTIPKRSATWALAARMSPEHQGVEHLEQAARAARRSWWPTAITRIAATWAGNWRRSSSSCALSRSIRHSRRPRPTWVRRCKTLASRRRLCRTARRRFAWTRIRRCCITIWATRCGRSSGWSMPRFLTSRRYGSTRSSRCRTLTWGWCCRRAAIRQHGCRLKRPSSGQANVDFWQWLAELHDEMEESADTLRSPAAGMGKRSTRTSVAHLPDGQPGRICTLPRLASTTTRPFSFSLTLRRRI